MSRIRPIGLAGLFLTCVGGLPAVAQEAQTTRIEPRAFYGATVTLEEGVRVFRPLPPHKNVVINPGGAPVNLSFNETTERSYHTYSGEIRDAREGHPAYVGGGVPFGFGPAFKPREHGRSGHRSHSR